MQIKELSHHLRESHIRGTSLEYLIPTVESKTGNRLGKSLSCQSTAGGVLHFISRVLSITIQIFCGNPDLQHNLLNISESEAKGGIFPIKCRHLNGII